MARQLIQAVRRAATVTSNGYVSLIRDLESNLKTLPRSAEATTEKLEEWEAKLSELCLKVYLSTEEAAHVRDI